MWNSPTADLHRAAESWAEVRAHDQVMRYRRSGAGRVVFLLHAGGAEPLWPELLDALAARCRLVVPELPAGEADVAGWLADFVEGLGMRGIALVAAEELCIPALELALLESDQIARIVLVPGGRGREPGLGGALETAARGAPVPLLVVRRGQPAEDVLPLITCFLDGGGR